MKIILLIATSAVTGCMALPEMTEPIPTYEVGAGRRFSSYNPNLNKDKVDKDTIRLDKKDKRPFTIIHKPPVTTDKSFTSKEPSELERSGNQTSQIYSKLTEGSTFLDGKLKIERIRISDANNLQSVVLWIRNTTEHPLTFQYIIRFTNNKGVVLMSQKSDFTSMTIGPNYELQVYNRCLIPEAKSFELEIK
ncbi:MAG: DUF1425 domain-containing protein [Planctomycetes bacterium]|nr:DUF1425 domain-containing protein [Planctomycetota bacterium]